MWTAQSWYDQARAAATANAKRVRDTAEMLLRMYMGSFPGASREEVGRTLEKCNRERLAAVPDRGRYPELRGMPELIAASWRGTREGAGLDDTLAAVNANGLFYHHRYIASGRVKPKAHCSWVCFGTSDHGPLLGNNLDTGFDEPYGPPEWPMVNEHVFLGGVSSGVFLDEESPEIFPAPVFGLVARYCRSSEEAVEMLTRYNYFWGPGNQLVVDRNRRIAMVEKSACRIGVRWSGDAFGFVTAMTAEHPEMNRFLADRRAASIVDRKLPNPCADTRYWAAQDKRRGIMNRLMDEARKAPTLERLRALMQYRGPEGVVCDGGEVNYPGDPPIEHTVRTMIFCLSEGRALWWTWDVERNIPSWKNRREDVHFKDALVWER
jgi:hypothetical protein